MRSRIVLALGLMSVLIHTDAMGQDRYFDSNGVQIRYVDQGAGEPIVLIHGYTSTIERAWGETGVLANLARDHRVIAFDLRGHGKSGKPRDPAAYNRRRHELVESSADMAAVRVPMLGIIGSADAFIEGMKELKAIHPTLQLVVLNGAVHAAGSVRGAQRRPEFSDAIRSFVASNAERAPK